VKRQSFIFIVVIVIFSVNGIVAMQEVLGYIKNDEASQLRELLDRSLDLNARGRSKRTILHEAVSHNALNTAMLLLARGINPNIPDERGICPLHLAASYEDRVDIADLLLACSDITIDPPDQHGLTPLHFAVSLCNYPMIEKLMKAGANPSKSDENGWNAFDKSHGVSEILGLLLQTNHSD